MRAGDLTRSPSPRSSLDTEALTAARMIGEARLPGLIVVRGTTARALTILAGRRCSGS